MQLKLSLKCHVLCLFPEYWDTGSAYNNIIGIYWIEDEPIPGVTEEVVVTDKADEKGSNTGKTIATYNVVRVPFFKYPMNFYTPYKAVLAETYTDFTDIPDWKEAGGMWEQLTKKFPDKYSYADGKYYRLYSDGVTREIGSTAEENDINHECAKDIFALNNLYIYTQDGKFGLNDLSKKITCEFLPGQTDGASSRGKDADFYESWGIHVKLSDYKKFGFYLENNTKVMYSQTILNSLTSDGNEYKQPSYVATFLQGTDTEGNPKRHLCFEDWYADNFDLNDMVFRVYGFDQLEKPNPDIPIQTGKIEDIDHPDDKPFQWIIACEDLGGTDDYDFNDIVFGVEHIAGEREVYVTALAAGGTLPTYLYYKDHKIEGGVKRTYGENDFGQYTYYSPDTDKKTFAEWHEWFGSQYYHTSMINTKDSNSFKVGATVVLVLPEDEVDNFSMANTATPSITVKNNRLGGFSLKVIQTDGEESEIKAPMINTDGILTGGHFPQLFATTGDYKWPTERTPIYSTHIGNKDLGEAEATQLTINGKNYLAYPNSFYHWVNTGRPGFHSQEPTGDVITHNWKGSINKITSN